jgi:hypothetical protein
MSRGSKGFKGGRRGRKARKKEERLARQQRVNEQEKREEMEKRRVLAAEIKPWVKKMCGRSKCGLIHPFEKTDRSIPAGPFYSPEGGVGVRIDVDDVEIIEIIEWHELSSRVLKGISKSRWRPFRPKNILEVLAEL